MWLTRAEQTNFQETSRYDETIDFCKHLEKASPWIKFTSIEKSGEGRDIPLMIVSKDKIFDPKLAFKSSFAKSPQARLNFFYQRSPYWDNEMNLYPVARVVSGVKFVTEPIKE